MNVEPMSRNLDESNEKLIRIAIKIDSFNNELTHENIIKEFLIEKMTDQSNQIDLFVQKKSELYFNIDDLVLSINILENNPLNITIINTFPINNFTVDPIKNNITGIKYLLLMDI